MANEDDHCQEQGSPIGSSTAALFKEIVGEPATEHQLKRFSPSNACACVHTIKALLQNTEGSGDGLEGRGSNRVGNSMYYCEGSVSMQLECFHFMVIKPEQRSQ